MLRETDYTKIRNARASHARWVRRAKHLVEGLPVSEDMIPIDSTSCDFGVWLYGEGMKLKTNAELSKILTTIEEEHHNLHDIYLAIYKIYFVDTKSSWLRSLLTNKYREVTPNEQELAQMHFETLEKISMKLMSHLEEFENIFSRMKLHDIYYKN